MKFELDIGGSGLNWKRGDVWVQGVYQMPTKREFPGKEGLVGNVTTPAPQEVLISFHRSACGQRPLDIDFMAKRPKECQTMERKKSLEEAMGRVL